MTASGGILVLADGPVTRQVEQYVAPERCAAFGDPYDALVELSRRPWPAVLLGGPRSDFPGLCRAARRLQRDARLYAVCSPAEEAHVGPLVGGPLDDYFITPLSRRDLAGLRQAVESPFAWAATAGGPAATAARQTAELMEAARDVAGLEGLLARTVGALVGAPVAWLAAAEAPEGARPLLRAANGAPRVLMARGSVRLSEAARDYLAAAQACLPALLAAARRTEELYRLSVTDHLTGAYNRRHFYERTDEILLRADRERFRVTLLLYDIDDFKRYNDTYGHAAGDEILRDTARLMRHITRAQDIVARIGGDEFAVLFWDGEKPRAPGSRPPETAYALVDRFRKALRIHAFRSLGPEARGSLTISGGLASWPADGRTVRELLRRADAALREAKRSGKNAVHLVGTEA